MADDVKTVTQAKGQGDGERLARIRQLLDAMAACETEDLQAVLDAFGGDRTGAAEDCGDTLDFWQRVASFEDIRAEYIAASLREMAGRAGGDCHASGEQAPPVIRDAYGIVRPPSTLH